MTLDGYDRGMRKPFLFESPLGTVDDPILVTTFDQRLFQCFTANIAGRGDRWIYVSSDRVRHDGGIYAGENTLEQIQQRVDEWWRDRKFREF